MGKFIRSARTVVRRKFPSAIELVYDNHNFLVFGFGSTERASDAIVSLTANAQGMGLCFIHGAKLEDPGKILQGGGNQTRFIRLESAATLLKPEVEALMKAAIEQANSASCGGTRLHGYQIHLQEAETATKTVEACGENFRRRCEITA